MSKTVCGKNQCCGCMACLDICPKAAIIVKDSIDAYNAVIDEDSCINCDLCKKVCQRNELFPMSKATEWHQGWTLDEKMRNDSSSGGVAAEIEKSFIVMGGVVYSCKFKEGEFLFDRSEDEKSIYEFSGSKYVKSNPQGIYKKIRADLEENRAVLLVALPCQVGAAKKSIPLKLHDRFYTVDLICHGSPSPLVLKQFLKQYDIKLTVLKKIDFRRKKKYQLSTDKISIEAPGICDCYMTAFLNGLCFTENCYNCDYASMYRVSDITLGDSWGSELDKREQEKGVSLILCQTQKGRELLDISQVHLEDVDIKKAILHNKQLATPSQMPKKRDFFLNKIKEKHSFNWIIRRCYPWICFKQFIKSMIIKVRFINIE